jgi:hypothetical protein
MARRLTLPPFTAIKPREATLRSAAIMADWPVHGNIDGPLVMIGFGSIGRGTLPLIERHFTYDKSRFVVVDPSDANRALLDERGIPLVQTALTPENFREVLTPLLTAGGGRGFCVNLSVDTSSLDIMALCRELGVLYVDTVIEPWPGFYFDRSAGPEARTNYALREGLLALRRRSRAVSSPAQGWGRRGGRADDRQRRHRPRGRDRRQGFLHGYAAGAVPRRGAGADRPRQDLGPALRAR